MYGAGYRYYEGLVQIATKTLYGDENDLETYPGIGAEGITFNVKTPDVINLDLRLLVSFQETYTRSDGDNTIKDKVIEYVNSLKLGENVVLERIRSKVMELTFVQDVSIQAITKNDLPHTDAENDIDGNVSRNIVITEKQLARIVRENITVVTAAD